MEHITYCYNLFYNITNILSSLWFAKEQLDDDLLVLNVDAFFCEILELVTHDNRNPVMVIDHSRIAEGDYFSAQRLVGVLKSMGRF